MINKDENVQRFALSTIRGKLLDRERKKRERDRGKREEKKERERRESDRESVTQGKSSDFKNFANANLKTIRSHINQNGFFPNIKS